MQSTSVTQTKKSNVIPIITKREQEVLFLIAYEQTTKEIAHQLNVSFETVNSHRQNLLRKLDVKNTAGLVRVACQKKLIQFR